MKSGLSLHAILLLLLAVALTATSCFDEDKTDCRTHADCYGVRECIEGACVTPEQFENNPFADDDGMEDDDTETDDSGLTRSLTPIAWAQAPEALDGLTATVVAVDREALRTRLTLRLSGGDRLVVLDTIEGTVIDTVDPGARLTVTVDEGALQLRGDRRTLLTACAADAQRGRRCVPLGIDAEAEWWRERLEGEAGGR